jgi:PAS domain S-box-containing protein
MVSVKYNKITKADLIEELQRLQRKIKRLESPKSSKTTLKDKQKKKSNGMPGKILEESEQNYRSLIESSLNAIYVLQNDKLVLVNHAWEELFGYSSDEVLNKTFDPLIVIAPAYHQVYESKKLATGLNIPFNPRFDVQGLTKDGNLIDLEAIVTEIFWNGKKAIQGIYRNITERKRIEEALRREAFIFDNLYDAVIISDLSGFIMNWNSAATRMFGYSKNEILNKNINILNKDDNNFIEKIIRSVEKDGKWTGEITFKNKDDSNGISETIIFPFLDAHGEKIALVSVSKDITKKKESEEELKESEEKFRKIAENSFVGMYIIQDNVFKYVNPRFAEITGYKVEELIDLIGPLQITATEFYHLVEENIKNRINGNFETIQYEFKIVKKDKSLIDVETYGSRIMYQGRKAIAGTLLDITEQRQYENTLQESQKKYRELADFLPQTVFEIDLEGNLLFVNQYSFAAFKYDLDDFEKGLDIFQMMIPGERPKIVEFIRKALSENDTAEEEFVALRKDGTTFPVLVFSTTVIRDNKPIGLRGILIDITDRKQIESELRKLSRAVEQSPNSIMITNIFGDLEYVNPMFTQLTGYTFQEVVGKNPRFLKSGETNDGEYKKLWDTLLKNETWRGEFHNRKKNGELYWESVSISAIVDTHGKITHFLAIKEDITDKKNIEKELIKAKEKAEESDRLKSEFLAQMSHEIRSPINIILSYNSFIREEFQGKFDNYIDSSFNSIDTAGKRLLRTLDLILNMAAVQSGYVDLQFSPINLQTIIAELIKEFEFSAKNKNLNLLFSSETNKSKILADDYIVGEIFQNLIGNAIKYTFEGKVEVKVYESDGKLCIDVIDSGIGISEEYIPKLFLPFTQEETGYSRKYEGNGLGLALVKKYVELIDAEIKVVSKKGSGSIFTIIFNQTID